MTTPPPFPTALVGFGKMGQGYAADPLMARHFRYAAHAQVLRDHPAFDWRVVIDPDLGALNAASSQWGVESCAESPQKLGVAAQSIEVAVLATRPEIRLGLLDSFPNLRAVLVEKPLGATLDDANAFLAECAKRGIMVQVNLWRRADRLFRQLASGTLTEKIGEVQAVTCWYGNGLVNNGTHMIDFARMLFGEIEDAVLLKQGFIEGPITDDSNPQFLLHMASGLTIDFQPLHFAAHRECGFVIIGTEGRLDILAEGLSIAHYPRSQHRAMQGEQELVVDQPVYCAPTAGDALYAMFDNLAACLHANDAAMLCSPAASAMNTAKIVEQIRLADHLARTRG